MDVPRLVTILQDLGLPAAIAAAVTLLGRTIIDARQRSSKEALLDWLGQASTKEPFSGDDRALRALHELRQSLVFERAFGLKAESQLRNELLLFAESQRESAQFREVIYAGRLVSRLSLARLRSPKQPVALRRRSRITKPLSYVYVILGYLLMAGGIYVLTVMHWPGRLGLAALTFGYVFGGLYIFFGMRLLKQARRFEIAADFLSWRAKNQNSSLHGQGENTAGKTSDAA